MEVVAVLKELGGEGDSKEIQNRESKVERNTKTESRKSRVERSQEANSRAATLDFRFSTHDN